MAENAFSESFDAVFQHKVVAAFLTNGIFVKNYIDLIDSAHFDSKGTRWIVKFFKQYYIKYNKIPTLEVWKHEIGNVSDDVLRITITDELKSVYSHVEDTDLTYVKDRYEIFAKNQVMAKAILDSMDLLKRREFEKIRNLIDDALKAGSHAEIGLEYKNIDTLRSSITGTERNPIKTKWDVLNKYLAGGLGGGELGTIVAPSGIGKSWMLQNIGSSAIKNGKNVLHYTMELYSEYTRLRYDSILTGYPSQNLKYHEEEIQKQILELPGNMIIQYFPPLLGNINVFRNHIRRVIDYGMVPDLIIVDYGDLMSSISTSENRYSELGNIFTELRSLAGEFMLPIWTATQSRRSSINLDTIEADEVADSYKKVMVSDFVCSISRTLDDKHRNTARCHIIKNRFGKDGVTLPMDLNAENGTINIYEPDTVAGQRTLNKMYEDDGAKLELERRFKTGTSINI